MASEEKGSGDGKVVDLKKSTAKVPGAIRVFTRQPQGRWRAGRKFTVDAVEIPLSEISASEIAALESDPLLVCEHVVLKAGA